MTTILLMDDTVTAHGHMAGGCQKGLTDNGFTCEFEGGRDHTGAVLTSELAVGQRLFDRAAEVGADGVVLDIVWGENDWNGFEVWLHAKKLGLPIDNAKVVFLTQHRTASQLDQHAKDHGFSTKQVLYKNAQGNEAAVKWMCAQFGKPFAP